MRRFSPFALWRALVRYWYRLRHRLNQMLPRRLYARSLLIVIVPMVILQALVAWFFMERHWQLVTFRLSRAVVQDVAAVIDLYQALPGEENFGKIRQVANDRLLLRVEILPDTVLPRALPKPFFSLLDRALAREMARQTGRPFWIDTVDYPGLVEIRVNVEGKILRILAYQEAAYASNSHIFIVWMIAASLVLIALAIAFLRNQIRPIVDMARAAEAFGKGQGTDFRPRGALEVRQAGQAFMEMKRRIERAMEQRTAMLSGVSHDLRTILTRFRLSLALLDDGPEARDLQKDVDAMQGMLEGYLAFARGEGDEEPEPLSLRPMLADMQADAARHGRTIVVTMEDDPAIIARPQALHRCIGNLVSNALTYAPHVALTVCQEGRFALIHVDDDGPGIPAHQREAVFRPFYRLDEARNQNESGTGLGLAIARDIARAHGGDIILSTSAEGGLRASLRLPL